MTHLTEITKPRNDHREFRRFTLNNGLDCLLVHDSKTEKSSAGLTVMTGSYDDPEDLKGLAHFLEHMLFLGSQKYPRQNEYSDFIESNGGSSNAYTSDNSTFYYFDIPNDYFEKGLDIFGQFFISPLFTRDLVDREMCAVNSEYMIDLQSDSWRMNMIQRSLSNPAHPYHKFGIGNLETLKTDKTVDRLIEFYDSMYSSDIMYLVVVANQSLDHSERMVREVFESVPNKNLRSTLNNRVPQSEKPFDPPYSNRIIYTKPTKDSNKLLISYQLPSLSPLYRTKPDNILSHLIGHEGPGSILECMKRMGYAEALCAGADHGINTFSLFKISITLTKKGLANIPECVHMVDQYIEMLKRVGFDKSMCNEQRHLNALHFDQMDHEDAVDQVETLSNNIVMYEPKDILSGGYLIDEPTDEFIKAVNSILMTYFLPENRNIFIISHTFPYELFGKASNDWEKVKQREQWLKGEYFVASCNEVKSLTTKSNKNYGFHTPKPNPFIPENLKVLLPKPVLIRKDPHREIWYKFDTKFSKPVCCLDQMMYSPYVESNSHVCRIMTGIVMEELNSYTYDASLADLEFSISTRDKQMIVLHCSGYNDKFMVLLNRVTDQLFSSYEGLDRDQMANLQILFHTVKDKYLRKLKNRVLASVREQISETFHNITSETYIPLEREIEIVESITIDDVIKFKSNWYRTMYTKYLIQGNCYEKMILNHADRVDSIVNKSNPIAESPNKKVKYDPSVINSSYTLNYTPKVSKTLSTRNVTAVVRSNDPNNVCSGYMCYHVVDQIDLSKIASLKILGHIISEPFFDQLRTNEQLGYDVYGDMHRVGKLYGLCLRVISDTKDPEYLSERVESFMKGMGDKLSTISTEQFEEHVKGVVAGTLEPDTKLLDEFSRNSGEIMMGRYAFHSREVLAEQIEATSLDQVIKLYRQIVTTPNSLTIKVYPMTSQVVEFTPKLEFTELPFVFESMM
ncbi:insulin-degrading enzyme [Yasminevirus sp. GU-2018]|uniref:Insulin-degrading enzyme n=1 Tax=Yasminevirus sp. GU-2018 TaxID=2420051 RepID=A0A5K0UAK0_9VIRU|nr:insulin-degrading enzyme [Yasminevirus sp. GU-2018]